MMKSLDKYRAENQLTLDDLANLFGVSDVHMCRVIQGSRRPSIFLILKMHEKTSIPLRTLLYEAVKSSNA